MVHPTLALLKNIMSWQYWLTVAVLLAKNSNGSNCINTQIIVRWYNWSIVPQTWCCVWGDQQGQVMICVVVNGILLPPLLSAMIHPSFTEPPLIAIHLQRTSHQPTIIHNNYIAMNYNHIIILTIILTKTITMIVILTNHKTNPLMNGSSPSFTINGCRLLQRIYPSCSDEVLLVSQLVNAYGDDG